jgi:uncharacterized protein (TIGR01244 family)
MPEFERLTDDVWASPQITPAEVAAAREQGFAMLINNRPDDEEEDQPLSAQIEQAAREQGLDYVSIPVTHAGFSEPQIVAMAEALDKAEGKVLAFCRSGTRSTLLWALSQASRGEDPAKLAAIAQAAGYNLSPIAAMLDMLVERASD